METPKLNYEDLKNAAELNPSTFYINIQIISKNLKKFSITK